MKEREYLKELGKKITDSSVRKEIVNEYKAHIEDCKAALMEAGMTEVEAEEEAVRQMGYQWHLLEEKYMPWRKYESDPFLERGGYWYHKLHIYLYPFYYINYTLTTMGAMEFKKK